MKPRSLSSPATRPPITIKRLPIRFVSDDRRVITRPFNPGGGPRVHSLFTRLNAISEADVEAMLDRTCRDFQSRHENILVVFDEHYHWGAAMIGWNAGWSASRKLLAGAYLTMEYAIESAALFNPSIVAHPDQRGVPEGGLRFIMSLRATGEGHVSSIVFRTGVITAEGSIEIDPPARLLERSRIAPDRHYLRPLFARKLREMAVNGPVLEAVLGRVPEKFTLEQLEQAAVATEPACRNVPNAAETISDILWLARSNYHVTLPVGADLSELVIFPMSDADSNGIEDLRLVKFTDDDGSQTYFGTYTAYNGTRVLPMLIQTADFRRIEIHSLNGRCAANKGMALFPRKIGGHYVMCGRIDGENLQIMYSDYVHFWESARTLAAPSHPWGLIQIGNCGSPIETPEGWLLLTHAVGPMRSYCISAMLLDLDDPLKVRGALKEPLIMPIGDEREGYVPNVVYTCGALEHRGTLFVPYAVADKSTSIAAIDMGELLDQLLNGG